MEKINQLNEIFIKQKKEIAEVFGFETRNKYSIETATGETIGFAAEQGKSLLGVLSRYFLGHYRSFDINIFDANRKLVMVAKHPFRFIFQHLDILDTNNKLIGSLEQRFSLLSKKISIHNSLGSEIMIIESPIWKIWTFPILKHGREIAKIEKKWSGILKEALLDADNFKITFVNNELNSDERKCILAASIFIDINYFEKKAE